jgi:hypothetical protein
MKTLAVCAGLLAVLFITACGPATVPTTTPGSKLRGTWKSNDPTIYSGTLTITISSNNSNSNGQITITGYTADQTPSIFNGGDDNKRPFKDFTKGTALKWRLEVITEEKDSMEGIIYITDRGKEQEGIPFVYYESELWHDSSSSTGYKADKFLCFTFGGSEEKLENSLNHHEAQP